MLTAISDDLHTAWIDTTFLGLKFGRRVTVLRLPGGALWVHSPVPLTPELAAAVDALGPVGHIVAPNLMHHTSVPQWAAAYPEAVVHAPAGIAGKNKAVGEHRVLGAPDPAWGGALTPLPLQGLPAFDETLFLHEASGTLISADIALAIPPELKHWWTQMYLRMAGIHGQLVGCSLVHKATMKDKPAARASLERILEPAWDRLLVSHSSVVDVPDVKDLLAEAWAWVPR